MSTISLILHPYIKDESSNRSPEARLDEACCLAEAIDLDIADSILIPLRSVRPASYLGKGKIEEIGIRIETEQIELVVIDCSLSPVQQRNLEQVWKCKVIDRTALILEIFGERAQTKEGVLQVELAALEYQKSRLVRSWTHLERQRGGYGFIGGPGERQIELDRRMINDRISKIKKQLEKVKNTRGLHRKSRQKVPYPVVALVGYTNAGKSTLFNQLTGSDVFVEDSLFATLDPTMRVIPLPNGNKAIISDTVGFISHLPTELISAFRATLEEVMEAAIILHVQDISCPDASAQKEDVIEILENLGLQEKIENSLLNVINKIDLLDKEDVPELSENYIPVSALNGDGCSKLLEEIGKMLSRDKQDIEIVLNASEGKLIAWLYEHGENTKTTEEDGKLRIKVRLTLINLSRFEKMRSKNS